VGLGENLRHERSWTPLAVGTVRDARDTIAYLAARTLVTARAGLLVAALAAASPFLIWYSQEARAYSLFVLLAAASLAACAYALKSASRTILWIWAVSAPLAPWTEYFALFLVTAEAIAIGLSRGRRRMLVAPFSAVAVAGVALFPLAYHQERSTLNDWIAEIPLGERIRDAARWLALRLSSDERLLSAGVVVVSRAVAASLGWRPRR
jgi:hypothetical protein